MTLPSIFSSSVGGDNSIFPLPGNAAELSIKSGKVACRDIDLSIVRQKIVSLALYLKILLFHICEVSLIYINEILCVLDSSEH